MMLMLLLLLLLLLLLMWLFRLLWLRLFLLLLMLLLLLSLLLLLLLLIRTIDDATGSSTAVPFSGTGALGSPLVPAPSTLRLPLCTDAHKALMF